MKCDMCSLVIEAGVVFPSKPVILRVRRTQIVFTRWTLCDTCAELVRHGDEVSIVVRVLESLPDHPEDKTDKARALAHRMAEITFRAIRQARLEAIHEEKASLN